MKGKLILENGIIFEGNIFGYLEESVGEVVFNTGMTGYQEILTDPSYYGQIVTMTYPLIGNYGINLEDVESKLPKIKGFIVREKCDCPSNWRCEMDLEGYLKQNKIIGLEGIDTRALTKILRNSGTMKGIIATRELLQIEIEQKLANFNNGDAVKKVTTEESYIISGNGAHIAIMDFGIKENILRSFKQRNCKLTVFPAESTAKEILMMNPDLIEKPDGVILQFGGQTAINLAKFLRKKNISIFGTRPEQIDVAEDREKFDALLEDLNINRPKGKAVWSLKEGLEEATNIGYPVLVRPSYVLGGQGMEITYSEKELIHYLNSAFDKDKKNPVLIDRYLLGREIEVDAICDGSEILIPGIMEHLERAGVHSGDSITIYPSQNISAPIKDKILEYTKKVAIGLKVMGMINIQFIEYKDELYIIEVNPRASRTVPYISKVSKVPIIELATRVMLGEKLKDLGYGSGVYKEPKLVSVKVPVFST